uniref:DUF1308 domain-containing protein n=1 Tax=Echinostoma caproni TaxID=27848 RepID=A0A183BGE1_9TREM
LWIKAVTHDASRLNADWLGQASSSRAACLYLLVCRTSARSFLRILITVAGEREWYRGLYLLSQVVIVPDLVFADSPSALANKKTKPGQTVKNRQKTQLIMDVGNAFGALTMTANEAFLRSLRNKGLKHAALLGPVRALTETAARDDE